MALNFKETETKLTQLCEEDSSNPEIYQLIHDLTFNYLFNVLKPGSNKYDYEMIAYDVATDIFLRLQKGAKIEYWTNYISRSLYMYYLSDYERKNWSVVINTTQDANLEQNILQSCVGIRQSDYCKIEDKLTELYLEEFDSIINSVMNDTKFNFNTAERLNLQISVTLTLIKNKNTYFRIPQQLYPYVNIIINQIKTQIIQLGLFSRENTLDNIDISQLQFDKTKLEDD